MSSSGESAACELRSVTRRLAEGAASRVLFEGVDLRVDRGTWTTVVGPSGSGKTALLEVLGLLRRPDRGEVAVAGEVVDWDRPRSVARIRGGAVGFVFQFPALDDSATVRDNVLDGLRLAHRPVDGEAFDRLDRLAAEVGVHPLLDRRVDALSGGEKQRVSVLRAMIKRPLLLVADEPTASLDADARDRVMALLRRAVDDGAAVVVVTHERELAMHGSRRVDLDGAAWSVTQW